MKTSAIRLSISEHMKRQSGPTRLAYGGETGMDRAPGSPANDTRLKQVLEANKLCSVPMKVLDNGLGNDI